MFITFLPCCISLLSDRTAHVAAIISGSGFPRIDSYRVTKNLPPLPEKGQHQNKKMKNLTFFLTTPEASSVWEMRPPRGKWRSSPLFEQSLEEKPAWRWPKVPECECFCPRISQPRCSRLPAAPGFQWLKEEHITPQNPVPHIPARSAHFYLPSIHSAARHSDLLPHFGPVFLLLK